MVKDTIFYRRHAYICFQILRKMKVSAKKNLAWWFANPGEAKPLTYEEMSKMYDEAFKRGQG